MVSNPTRDPGVTVGISGDASEFNGAMDSAIGSLGALNAKTAAVATGGLALLAGAMAGKSVSAAADFESAMADVAKVTDRATANELSDDIQELAEEIPLSTEELANLTAQAGRFGVEGAENIEEFARVAGEMGAATTLAAEEAGRSLAKVAEATGEPLDDVQELGDSINELSNNMATNSQEIVDAAQRGGFALQDLGLRSDEILGLSAAMNEVAPTSRRAATMMEQMKEALTDNDNVAAFANLLGVTEEQFVQMREEEPQQLMLDIAESMEKNEEGADALSQSLNNRAARAFTRLTGRQKEMAEAMQISNQAMEEGGSLSREVAIETDTLSGQFQLLKSEINNVFVNIGEALLPAVKDLVAGFSELIDMGEDVAADMMPAIGDAADNVASTFESFINSSDGLETASDDVGNSFNSAAAVAQAAARGDWQTAMDEFESAAKSASASVRTTLVGEEGEGGLTAALSQAVTDAQQWMQTDGGKSIQTGFDSMLDISVATTGDIRGTLVGPDGESGILTEMVDQGVRFMKKTAPKLFGDAMEAIGSGIRRGLIDLTNPLRGEKSEMWDMLADGATWTIKNLPRLFIAVGQGIISAITQGVKGLFKGLVGNSVLKDEINKAGDWLVKNMGSLVGGVGGAIVDTIKNGITGLADIGTGLIDGIVNGIETAASKLGSAITDPINSAIKGINSTLQGVSIPTVSIGPWEIDTGAAGNAPGVKDEYTIDGMTLGGDTLIGSNAKLFPTVQTGGLIEEGGLAEVHSGERVVPAAQVEDRGPAPSGNTIIKMGGVTVHAQDGTDAGRKLRRELGKFDV